MEKKLRFECVRPIKEDAELIMQWRNDHETLKMSIHTAPKVFDQFFKEFLTKYFISPSLPPLFILFDNQRAAFVFFEQVEQPEQLHHRRCVEISINVAPEFRQKGLGTEILKETQEWIKKQGFDDILAIVKKENLASQKAFEGAGYNKLENSFKVNEKTGEKIEVLRYIARLTPSKENPVFVIAEAGSNWRMGTPDRDLEMAKKMIDIAIEAGADAVKFQIFRPETIYVPNAGKSGYLAEAGIEMEMHEMFADLSMPYEMIPELAHYCQKNGIEFMASAFSKSDFLAINPYVKYHKIASYEIGHIRLIELIAKTQKPTFMSTGAATPDEIAWSFEAFKNFGGKELILLQCTAKYPAEVDSMNLRSILWLKDRFKCEVGLSDHSRHPIAAPVAAVAFGAKVIEKHFTLHNDLPGPDHAFALTPHELKEMVSAIRRTELMLGSWVKMIHPSEEELRSFSRRGIQALRDIRKGDILQEGINIDILRPGSQQMGIHSKFIMEIEGKRAKRNISLGSGIQQGDWE